MFDQAPEDFIRQQEESKGPPPPPAGMERVWAFRGFAVYADYDGNAPDTDDYWIMATKELAEELARQLNEALRDDKDGFLKPTDARLAEGDEDGLCEIGIPFVDGWEHSKFYKVRETLLREDVAYTSIDGVLKDQ